ncbi:zinc finger protein 576, tandem duplicate 1 isoform X1 [Sebastes fasciatus]|uniref:zinc finger protein 576, tandem duplicate 1 isoform X1 n=1 Tax=Sebastes fasciatus TaxID=394691 RepID=UPI003D9E05F5
MRTTRSQKTHEQVLLRSQRGQAAMQSPTQSNSRPNSVTTATTVQPLDTEPEVQPAKTEPDAREEEENKSATPETVSTPQENGTGVQTAETPATSMAVTQAVNKPAVQPLTEPSVITAGTETDSASKPSAPPEPAPDKHANSRCDEQKAKKPDKGVRDGRKYVPSKKAMVDPLKMDMTKPLVMPLTSSQLSLQCIECHIIFSDHKSKERHLKLSHPAEYEQCILRNALFACYVCDRHFTNSTELMVHQKAHTEKKPFKCPICALAFKKSSELTHHKKIHFGQDGYACTDCGKPCKTMTLLKYHRRTHTGERPYVCKECGKRFTMSKALQKHMVSHLPEGAEGDGGHAAAKAQPKKDDGAAPIKYPCSVCKATFKSTKTRLHHMKTKHNLLPAAASKALPAGQQVKQSIPIITPISICQSALLQMGPNGPLQKVDGNIDTEQIRRLIESLGNVQKVNQVVILGQVPPHALPLEVQQISQLAETVNLNLNPPQIDFMGLKQTDSRIIDLDPSNNPCDSMEQTIILEPITPDGQLENPSFSELGSHLAVGENIELRYVQTEHTERSEGEVMHQILQQPDISAIQSDPMDQIICQNEEEQNLEETVILELIPTVELEESQTVQQNEIPSSSLVPTTDLEKTADQVLLDAQESSLSAPPLMTTVELELTPLQTEQQGLPSCPFVPPDTLTQTTRESECNLKEEVGSQMQTLSLDQGHPVMDGAAPQKTLEKAEQEPSEKLLVDGKEGQEQVENLSKVDDPPAKEEVPSHLETKQVPQMSELPVNVMSAQELVKVRKRKPTRAFIFQGYMQELVGSIYDDDLQIDATPAKRQRTKKSRLVVKFGPQSKEKKNKKQKKPSQQCQPMREEGIRGKTTNLSEKKAPLQKKGRKGKRDKKLGNLLSTPEIKSPSSTQDPQVQKIKGDTRKKKNKKQKEVAREGVTPISEHTTVASPVFKKKKQTKIMRKDQPKNAKDGKRKKNLAKEEKVNPKTSADIPGPQITQDALLLLKGHKQPQLKVYKLDPSKASSQTQEASPQEAQTTSQQSKDNKLKHSISEAESKKKGGRPKKSQKALSLLSSLQVSRQTPETLAAKPKTTRKRKSSPKVETEGVITSHSKRALECKECGQRFSEVSSLQKHKALVHIVESPGLTYTNGNIFEGVSRLDLYQLPKQHDTVVGVMNAATDWDTEPEIAEMALEERERSVSFPALIPSPSLPVPPSDVEASAYENKAGTQAGDQSHTSPEVHSPSDQMKTSETPPNFTSKPPLSASTQTKSSETGEPLASAGDKPEEGIPRNLSSESEVQGTTDEDIKEDLHLEIVTVGEQNERDESTPHEDTVPQNESSGTCNSESGSTDKLPGQDSNETTTGRSLTSHTVSCSTHQVEIKEEEEELLVQKKREGGKGAVSRNATRGRRRGTGRLKRDTISKRVSVGDTARGAESEKEQDGCQVVYERRPISSDSEMNDEGETGKKTSKPETSPEANKATAPVASLPSMSSTLEASSEEQVVFELESVTPSVEKVMNPRRLHRGEEHDRESDQSPDIILEKFIASGQRVTADEEPCLMTSRINRTQGLDSIAENEALGSQEIKVEENISDPPLVAPTCQNKQSASVQPQHHHRDIRTVLVKEESSLVLNETQATPGSRHIRWNVEPVNNENTSSPLMESGETTMDEGCVTPEFNTNQCIFYPVKEEEREVLLGAVQTNSGSLTTDAPQTEHTATDSNLNEGSHSTPDYQEMRVRGLLSEPRAGDFADGQAEADAELQHPPDLRDFLLQSSDEEDVGDFELSDPQLDSEAQVMAYFCKNQTNSAQPPDEMSQNLPTSTSQLQAPREENRTRDPIDYFSNYFGWDTWEEIANCTNKLSNMPKPVTAREVAQFVGIHIAMGTLKFPSPRLYWEDLTKVPLIAEAMPLPRFLELSRMLKLASPAKDPVSSNVQGTRHDGDFQNAQRGETLSSRQSETCQYSDGQMPNELNSSKTQTDPLWRALPLLCRFKAGCQSLRREGDYAVDQYPLPLTGKMNNKKLSLYCTTLIGFGGLLLHVDLKLGLSGKEDAVEKMVPKGSMVFLCKQELSTPAMLERLLAAGVHGAGRVGGARGQIGDEFVSSDGKLMLRRSHCGFILSTAGNGQRNMASLIDNFEKAQMSAHLNRDLQNLYSIPLTASAPTCWPQAVLWYLTDLALVNSWLLYRQDHGTASAPLTLMAFRLEVSKVLIRSSGSDTQDSVPPQPPKEKAHATNETPNPGLVEESPMPDAATRYDGSGHWPEQLGEGEGGRCRFGDCQRTSRVLCLKCCVFLCISRNHNCFLNFHNQGTLGEE